MQEGNQISWSAHQVFTTACVSGYGVSVCMLSAWGQGGRVVSMPILGSAEGSGDWILLGWHVSRVAGASSGYCDPVLCSSLLLAPGCKVRMSNCLTLGGLGAFLWEKVSRESDHVLTRRHFSVFLFLFFIITLCLAVLVAGTYRLVIYGSCFCPIFSTLFWNFSGFFPPCLVTKQPTAKTKPIYTHALST